MNAWQGTCSTCSNAIDLMALKWAWSWLQSFVMQAVPLGGQGCTLETCTCGYKKDTGLVEGLVEAWKRNKGTIRCPIHPEISYEIHRRLVADGITDSPYGPPPR